MQDLACEISRLFRGRTHAQQTWTDSPVAPETPLPIEPLYVELAMLTAAGNDGGDSYEKSNDWNISYIMLLRTQTTLMVKFSKLIFTLARSLL